MITKLMNLFSRNRTNGISHDIKQEDHAVKSNGVEFKKIDGKVTGQTTIGEIIQNYPSAVEILSNEGVGCVGCSVAYWESIEEGLLSHGKSEMDVERVLNQINKQISSENVKGDKLMITQAAIKKIKLMGKKSNMGLRVNVVPGGCSGYQYDFKLDDKSGSDDVVIEQDGVKVILSNFSMEKLQGSKLDYLDSLQGAGFKISNPNVHKTCGCGSSFN